MGFEILIFKSLLKTISVNIEYKYGQHKYNIKFTFFRNEEKYISLLNKRILIKVIKLNIISIKQIYKIQRKAFGC